MSTPPDAPRPHIRLFYLNGRGPAEFPRFLLAYAGIPFEDCRLTFRQWKLIKGDDEGLVLPLLEVDENVYSGAHHVTRYLAKRFDMGLEEGEGVVERVMELQAQLAPVLRTSFSKNERNQRLEWALFKKKHLNQFLATMTRVVQEGGRPWIFGNKVTWADLGLGEMLSRLEDCYDGLVLKDYPELKTFATRITQLPRLRNWIDQRPLSTF